MSGTFQDYFDSVVNKTLTPPDKNFKPEVTLEYLTNGPTDFTPNKKMPNNLTDEPTSRRSDDICDEKNSLILKLSRQHIKATNSLALRNKNNINKNLIPVPL